MEKKSLFIKFHIEIIIICTEHHLKIILCNNIYIESYLLCVHIHTGTMVCTEFYMKRIICSDINIENIILCIFI